MKSSDSIGVLAGIGEKPPRTTPTENKQTTLNRWRMLGREILKLANDNPNGLGHEQVAERIGVLCSREALAQRAASAWPRTDPPPDPVGV